MKKPIYSPTKMYEQDINDLVETEMNKSKHPKREKVMNEFKHGELHSGSKKGPKVTNPKQAVAIAYSEERDAKKK